jgi:CRISPR-associated protein Cas5d
MSSNGYPPLTVRVWGDYACWTRPEMKVERVTYPVMPPTAARGILEAIFWKPEFTWQVRQIDVVRPIRYLSLVRNEVSHRASPRVASIDITDPRIRTQRHALILRDVVYFIHADIALRPHATDDVAKYRDQFRRRVEQGACAHRPYLGCREFSAFFGPGDLSEPIQGGTLEVAAMTLSVAYPESGLENAVFRAVVEDGRLQIPAEAH